MLANIQANNQGLPAALTDEQRRRVADALESAQSENTRINYASQFGKFRSIRIESQGGSVW